MGQERCGFCNSDFTLHERDLHTVCPQCLSRVSDRSKFCHSCGDRLTAELVAGEPLSFSCPACGAAHKLLSRRLGKERISVAECQRCAGLWISQTSFGHLRDRAAKNALPVQNLFPVKPATQRKPPQGGGYRNCVQCPQLMNRRQYAPGSGVVVDVCREHGIWFDDEELAQILAWIAQGGGGEGRLDPNSQPNVGKPPVLDSQGQQGQTFFRETTAAREVDRPVAEGIESALFDMAESVLAPLARLDSEFNRRPPGS